MRSRLEKFMTQRRCTLLGVGPMSKNCVDAAIELANEQAVPILLIASRRQIEMGELGGGYVNNWTTEAFAQYVKDRDKQGNIIIARDHSGPWQHPVEVEQKMSLRRAMDTVKHSLQTDIESGFDMLHLDPSIDIFSTASVDDILQRVFELYEFCFATARRLQRNILFEVGTDEQGRHVQDTDQLEYVLVEIQKFCEKNGMPPPDFIVAQTGTKVMEMRNIGSFDSPFRIDGELPIEIQLPRILSICQKHKIWLKEHNTDYLSDASLSWHPKIGIHAANVAPEFGVVESRALVQVLADNGLTALRDRFLKLAYDSNKWKKWMLPNTKATDQDRAVIAGHYVYAVPAFQPIYEEAKTALAAKNISLDEVLKSAVKASIYRYLRLFNLLKMNPS